MLSPAVGSISVVAVTLAIVIFTPVRQLVPGYIKKELVEQSLRDRMRLDSLQMRMEAQNAMLKVLTHTPSCDDASLRVIEPPK